MGFTSALSLLFAGTLIALPGQAEVGLRVESHPISAPIDAYVRVTEGTEPVTGLTPADFAVTLDGAPVDFTLTLPPNQDSSQKVSVVIVINNSEFAPTRDYSPLIAQLALGDFVSVVKYAADFDISRLGGLWVLPFTEIDDGPGLDQIQDFIQDRQQLTSTGGRFLFEGLMEGISQMAAASATLPEGPKAIATVECCGGRVSLSQVVASANANSIPIFDVAHSAGDPSSDIAAPMRSLATATGGIRVRSLNNVASMGSWLRDGYRVTIPHTAIGDCRWHKLGITVGGESKSVTFSRCDTTPEDFRLRDLYDADVAKHVRAKAVITGIETAVPVHVDGGQYSVGCTSAFTSGPGRIRPGQSVCVRHTTAASGGLEVATLLTVGGVSEWFISQTAEAASTPSGQR
jgi:hypothetical protein